MKFLLGGIVLLLIGLLAFYFLQGPAHEGLKASSFKDKEFNLNEIVKVESKQDKPNFVFILADDLGYGDVGYNDQTVINTQNLDRLAKERDELAKILKDFKEQFLKNPRGWIE